RSRKDLIKSELTALLASSPRPLRILAIASGPAQELLELFAERPEMRAPVEIILFDQDKGALAYAYRRLKPVVDPLQPHVKMSYLNDSIKRLIRDSTLFEPFGAFDLIYSVGLFDYLRTSTAVGLARNLIRCAAPGGPAATREHVRGNRV